MSGLLFLAGMGETDALVCTLFVRVTTYWTATLVGSAALIAHVGGKADARWEN